MQDTPWEYSNVEDYSHIEPEAGWRYLYIESARLNPEGRFGETYELNVQDLQNNASFQISWTMKGPDQFNNITVNNRAMGTLVGLKKSIFGPEAIGVPNPMNIAGTVVLGQVSLKETASGRKYPRVYQFKPVTADWAALGYHGPDSEEPQYVEPEFEGAVE